MPFRPILRASLLLGPLAAAAAQTKASSFSVCTRPYINNSGGPNPTSTGVDIFRCAGPNQPNLGAPVGTTSFLCGQPNTGVGQNGNVVCTQTFNLRGRCALTMVNEWAVSVGNVWTPVGIPTFITNGDKRCPKASLYSSFSYSAATTGGQQVETYTFNLAKRVAKTPLDL